MATTPNSIVTPQSVNTGAATFTDADTTVAKTVFTAGANGSVVRGIFSTSNDTATINAKLFLNDGSTSYLIGTVRVVTLVGTDGAVNGVDLLNTTALPGLEIDGSGNAVLFLKTGWTIKIGCLVTMTAGKTFTVVANGKDF